MYGNGVSGRAARVDARPCHCPSSAAQRGAKFDFPQFRSHQVSYVGYIQHPAAVDISSSFDDLLARASSRSRIPIVTKRRLHKPSDRGRNRQVVDSALAKRRTVAFSGRVLVHSVWHDGHLKVNTC